MMVSKEAKIKLNTIEEAIADIKQGKVIIVVDDENREIEGDFIAAAETVKECLKKHLAELKELSAEELVEQRYQKFRAMTVVEE